MHKIVEWFIRNPVATNLIAFLIIVSGLTTILSIRIETVPSTPPTIISIKTVCPGANAELVDRSVSRRIEKALEGTPGLRKISSFSSENLSVVKAKRLQNFDIDRFQNEIKTRIDAINNLPAFSERPSIFREEVYKIPAIYVQVYGDKDLKTLQKTARIVKERLENDPMISRLETFAKLPYEIRVEVDEEKLTNYGLSIDDITEKINENSLDYRTGSLKSKSGKIILKADKKAFRYEDYANIPVKTLPDGRRILMKDVAEIVDGFKEVESFARFQGKPSVGITIFNAQKEHILKTTKNAKKIVEELKGEMPEGVYIETWGGYSDFMQQRLKLLAENGIQGLFIVLILLALFLNFKLAFWIAMGIPIAVFGAGMIMGPSFLDYSLNDITTFGFIVVLGILVDDAVVVGESVYEEKLKSPDKDAVQATVLGVERVAKATIFGAFTTIGAFFPLTLMTSEIGKIMVSFSVVVIAALFFSLFESKFILPCHLANVSVEIKSPKTFFGKIYSALQAKAMAFLQFLNKKIYQPLLEKALRHTYSSLLIIITIALIGIGLLEKGIVRTVFFPDVPGQVITVSLKMNSSMPISLTIDNLEKIEREANELNREFIKKLGNIEPPIKYITTNLIDLSTAKVYAEIQPQETKKVDTMLLVEKWRDRVGKLEGAEKLTYQVVEDWTGGFIIEVSSAYDYALKNATLEVVEALKQQSGVNDINTDLNSGKPQINLHLKEEAQHLGVSVADLAEQIGNAYGGLEVYKIQRDGEEVKVFVKYQKNKKKYINDLLSSRIQNADGKWLPLTSVAEVRTEITPVEIIRRNGKRTVQVKASIDKKLISQAEVFEFIEQGIAKDLQSKYPDVKIAPAGDLEEMEEVNMELLTAFLMIIVLIYSLLAVPLKSYFQPLIIMAAIPFSIVGAILGHWIMGYPVSFISFFGILAVMGVVVNASLVMLTRFNQLREEGLEFEDALKQAGIGRFRAIFLTTVTTSAGLMPLMMEKSEQAQYLIPAAVSIAYGVIFSTIITLLLIPLLIKISENIKMTLKSLKKV